MRITRGQLGRIIREEAKRLRESSGDAASSIDSGLMSLERGVADLRRAVSEFQEEGDEEAAGVVSSVINAVEDAMGELDSLLD